MTGLCGNGISILLDMGDLIESNLVCEGATKRGLFANKAFQTPKRKTGRLATPGFMVQKRLLSAARQP
jgi:hypothetical protein